MMGYRVENMPHVPKPAATILYKFLEETGIDINHPVLADFSKWLDTATNSEIAAINRLMAFNMLDLKLTAELLGQTWDKLRQLNVLINVIYMKCHGYFVLLHTEEMAGQRIFTSKINPARLPAIHIDLMIAYLQAQYNDQLEPLIKQANQLKHELVRLYSAQENAIRNLDPAASEVASEGEELDQQALAPQEIQAIVVNTLEGRGRIRKLLPMLIQNESEQKIAKENLGETFVLWHMRKEGSKCLHQSRILAFEQESKQITLTPETGAIVPYQPAPSFSAKKN